MEPIAIIGMGMTEIKRERLADTVGDLVYEACTAALADASLSIQDIDVVITCSNDFFDGRTISSMAVQDACGSYDKNVSTVEGDGTFGAVYAAMRVLAGAGTCLFVAHHKGSESVMRLITNAMFDPIFERFLGIEAISASALQARSYMDRYGVTEEDCARVSVKNHANAKANPIAQMPLDLTVEEVMASPYLADPLKLLDCSPVSDAASAIIIAGEKHATAASKPVWIKGFGHSCDAFHLGDRDLARTDSLEAAARTAYSMAGISDPRQQVDLVELYDAFSYMELMWLEGLGLCDKGEAASLTASGATAINGKLPVNASGGCLSGNPILVAGLNRIIESTLQIRGDAGAHQAGTPKTAVAQGFNGPCGQSQCVWVLGGEK